MTLCDPCTNRESKDLSKSLRRVAKNLKKNLKHLMVEIDNINIMNLREPLIIAVREVKETQSPEIVAVILPTQDLY